MKIKKMDDWTNKGWLKLIAIEIICLFILVIWIKLDEITLESVVLILFFASIIIPFIWFFSIPKLDL